MVEEKNKLQLIYSLFEPLLNLDETISKGIKEGLKDLPQQEIQTEETPPVPRLTFCKNLGITPPTFDRWAKEKRFEIVKHGRLIYVNYPEYKRFLKSRKG